MPHLTLPAPRRLYPYGPGTVKLGVLDNFLLSSVLVQIAPVAAQSVVAGRWGMPPSLELCRICLNYIEYVSLLY